MRRVSLEEGSFSPKDGSVSLRERRVSLEGRE